MSHFCESETSTGRKAKTCSGSSQFPGNSAWPGCTLLFFPAISVFPAIRWAFLLKGCPAVWSEDAHRLYIAGSFWHDHFQCQRSEEACACYTLLPFPALFSPDPAAHPSFSLTLEYRTPSLSHLHVTSYSFPPYEIFAALFVPVSPTISSPLLNM